MSRENDDMDALDEYHQEDLDVSIQGRFSDSATKALWPCHHPHFQTS
jgi:hypothetical protein